jgi:hypothetical protein
VEETHRQTAAVSGPLPGNGTGQYLGAVKADENDECLPMEDHTTRIIVSGQNGAQAMAHAIAQEASHNVAYLAGTFETLLWPTASK